MTIRERIARLLHAEGVNGDPDGWADVVLAEFATWLDERAAGLSQGSWDDLYEAKGCRAIAAELRKE